MKVLTQERMMRGWTKAELARRAALNAATVGQIEAGRLVPYPGQLRKVASALGISEGDSGRLLDEIEPRQGS